MVEQRLVGHGYAVAAGEIATGLLKGSATSTGDFGSEKRRGQRWGERRSEWTEAGGEVWQPGGRRLLIR